MFNISYENNNLVLLFPIPKEKERKLCLSRKKENCV